ncbi:unnamed protein product [Umbelopsis vinacea]
MASTPSQDNNDVSFDDYKTSNARFQSKLRAMRQPSEASHSSRSSEPSARPQEREKALLLGQIERMREEVDYYRQEREKVRRRRKEMAGRSRMTFEERMASEKDAEEDLQAVIEYLLSPIVTDEERMTAGDSLNETNLRIKALQSTEVIRASEVSHIAFTDIQKSLEKTPSQRTIGQYELTGKSFDEEFRISFRTDADEGRVIDLVINVSPSLYFDIGPFLEIFQAEGNLLGFFRVLVHQARLLWERSRVFQALRSRYEDTNVKVEEIGYEQLKFSSQSDNEPDLVLSWEMPRAQIPEQVDGMDVPKRESPVIQLEAIVSHHWSVLDADGVMSKLPEQFQRLMQRQGVEQATATLVSAFMAEDTSRHYRRITKTASASPVQHNELTIDDAFESAIDQFVSLDPVKQLVELVRQSCLRHADQQTQMPHGKPPPSSAPKPKSSTDLPIVSLPFRFVPPSSLSPSGQKAYYSILDDDTRQMANPHQYLYWASLLDVHPMMAKARSLLSDVTQKAWIRSVSKSGIAGDEVKPARELENYLVLRQLQNEAYAKSAVAEGIKLYNENHLKDALDYYKRAVNMDPKCAEAWYRASQVFVLKKNNDEAIKNLERALRLQPDYEDARVMLQNLQNSTKEMDNNDLIIDTADAMKEYEDRHKEPKEKEHKKKRRRDDDRQKRSRHKSRSRSRSPRRRRSESRERKHRHRSHHSHRRHRDSDSDDESRSRERRRKRHRSRSSRRRSNSR